MEEVYRPVPGCPGLEVTADAKFRMNGRPRKAIYARKRYANHRATVRFVYMVDGVSHYISAAKCVAMAWKHGYTEDDYIIYKDGDCHNICADNLQIVDKSPFFGVSDAPAAGALYPFKGPVVAVHSLCAFAGV